MYISEKNLLSALRPHHRRIRNSGRGPLAFGEGFTLIETVAALAILSLFCVSILVVIDRCVGAMADSDLRMQAFEVARDNMEKLLIQARVEEKIEYGSSEKNPDILWQNAIETFYEPLTSRMWVKATCSAQYTDTEGEVQTVELTHWLTSVTKKQILQMAEERKKELQRLSEADQLIETIEEAGEYAAVDVETIEQWAKSGGMPVTEDGGYVKLYLDLYAEYEGDPPIEARLEADEEYAALTGRNVTGGLVPTGPAVRVPGMPGTTPGAPLTPGAPAGSPETGASPRPSAGPGGGAPAMTLPEWEALGFPSEWYPLFYPGAAE